MWQGGMCSQGDRKCCYMSSQANTEAVTLPPTFPQPSPRRRCLTHAPAACPAARQTRTGGTPTGASHAGPRRAEPTAGMAAAHHSLSEKAEGQCGVHFADLGGNNRHLSRSRVWPGTPGSPSTYADSCKTLVVSTETESHPDVRQWDSSSGHLVPPFRGRHAAFRGTEICPLPTRPRPPA